MGSYRRLQIAIVLLLALFSFTSSYAGTRKTITVPSGSTVVTAGGSSSKSGSVLSIEGPLIGEFIPGTTIDKKIPIKVLPTLDYSIPTTISMGNNAIRGGLVGFAATMAMDAMLDAVGGFIDENQQPVKHVDTQNDPVLSLFWCAQTSPSNCYTSGGTLGNKRFETPSAFVDKAGSDYGSGWTEQSRTIGQEQTSPQGHKYVVASLVLVRPYDPNQKLNLGPWNIYRHGTCSADFVYDPSLQRCTKGGGNVPLEESDYTAMTDFANSQSSEWIKGLLQDACSGSPSPNGCLDSLVAASKLSGPASVSSTPSTTTTTTTAGGTSSGPTTTTTTTTYDITYGDTYIDYSKHTSTTTTAPDGTVTTSETSEDPAPTEEEKPEEEIDFTDSPMPEVTPFYEQKYPDGFQGAWQSRTAELNHSAFLSFLRSFVPNFSGSCPGWGLDFNLGYMSLGSHNFMSFCYVFDFVGVVLLVTAAFMSRRIMFGG